MNGHHYLLLIPTHAS